MPSIAIIGASADRNKFGNKAVRVYVKKGYTVYPIHPKAEEIEGLKVYRSVTELPEKELDMVSFYLPPEVGMNVIDDLSKIKVKEVWLNPGSESSELVAKAEKLGLTVIQACSIVSAGMNPSQF